MPTWVLIVGGLALAWILLNQYSIMSQLASLKKELGFVEEGMKIGFEELKPEDEEHDEAA